MKTTPIPVKFDRQGHSCNFYGGLGPTRSCRLSGVGAMMPRGSVRDEPHHTSDVFFSVPTINPWVSYSVTVAILAQGTSWAVAVTQAFLLPLTWDRFLQGAQLELLTICKQRPIEKPIQVFRLSSLNLPCWFYLLFSSLFHHSLFPTWLLQPFKIVNVAKVFKMSPERRNRTPACLHAP